MISVFCFLIYKMSIQKTVHLLAGINLTNLMVHLSKDLSYRCYAIIHSSCLDMASGSCATRPRCPVHLSGVVQWTKYVCGNINVLKIKVMGIEIENC